MRYGNNIIRGRQILYFGVLRRFWVVHLEPVEGTWI